MLTTSKIPITVCDMLYERVLPFYDRLGITVGAILTDSGRPELHPYDLLLAMEDIEHCRGQAWALRS